MDAAYEQFLAELVFSTNDPRVDIVNNIDRCADDEWLTWLEKKVEASRDPDERVAMRDLYEMIIDVKEKMELSQTTTRTRRTRTTCKPKQRVCKMPRVRQNKDVK